MDHYLHSYIKVRMSQTYVCRDTYSDNIAFHPQNNKITHLIFFQCTNNKKVKIIKCFLLSFFFSVFGERHHVCVNKNMRHVCISLLFNQFVFKTEACGFRTVHEELAKGMTSDLKSNEPSMIRNVLKVSQHSHFCLKEVMDRF